MRLVLAAVVLLGWVGALGCVSPRKEPVVSADAVLDYDSLAPLRDAAEAGDPRAQLELGRRYREARGLPADNISAYVWFRLASVHGIEAAMEARDEVAAVMTEEEIERAEIIVRQWARFYFQDAFQKLSAGDRFGPERRHDSPGQAGKKDRGD